MFLMIIGFSNILLPYFNRIFLVQYSIYAISLSVYLPIV
ncbi:hypothetical protein UNSWDHB_1645 [Dehalobacter sp. UNSWDHB]|nr:hypothetical protein DHBDCA_p2248 [Dehalobacter sp. DCA]AFV06261.1 hypothetical protein DCF50_p2258 [Dehalobacter sp. CF]EQB21021.1 hypothetical protein UNSWDHB_1645 [Dehalobacter sp. UNSWDHB]